TRVFPISVTNLASLWQSICKTVTITTARTGMLKEKRTTFSTNSCVARDRTAILNSATLPCFPQAGRGLSDSRLNTLARGSSLGGDAAFAAARLLSFAKVRQPGRPTVARVGRGVGWKGRQAPVLRALSAPNVSHAGGRRQQDNRRRGFAVRLSRAIAQRRGA